MPRAAPDPSGLPIIPTAGNEKIVALLAAALILFVAGFFLYRAGYFAPGQYEQGRQAYLESFFVIDFKIDSSGTVILHLTSNLADNVTFLPNGSVNDRTATLTGEGGSLPVLYAGKRESIVFLHAIASPIPPVGTWVEYPLSVQYTLAGDPGVRTSTGHVRGQIEKA